MGEISLHNQALRLATAGDAADSRSRPRDTTGTAMLRVQPDTGGDTGTSPAPRAARQPSAAAVTDVPHPCLTAAPTAPASPTVPAASAAAAATPAVPAAPTASPAAPAAPAAQPAPGAWQTRPLIVLVTGDKGLWPDCSCPDERGRLNQSRTALQCAGHRELNC